MGHLHDIKSPYRKLKARIDQSQVGLPDGPEVYEILRHLFTDEEARIAAKLPLAPRKLSTIARRTGLPASQLQAKLEHMAEKGLVFDFHHPTKGAYFMLAPPVVGFFEFSMMRVRGDIDQKQVAQLLASYMFDRPDFMQQIHDSGVPIGRTVVHENTVAPEFSSDVLDFERATQIIESAPLLSLSMCYCRHKKQHLGQACDRPVDVCMSLGKGAEFVIRNGHGRRAEKSELLEVLASSREHGMVQIADNVRNEPTYLCNCCGCCCGQLGAINRHGLSHAVATSSFLATIEHDTCSGCGKCARSCPIQAICLRPRAAHEQATSKKKMAAEVDNDVCLGCGICQPMCKTGSLTMKPRAKRMLTPENTLERVLRMAMGRGHLHDLLFDSEDGPTAAFLNRLVGAVENLPVTRRALLNETLQSKFVAFLNQVAKHDKRQPIEIIQ